MLQNKPNRTQQQPHPSRCVLFLLAVVLVQWVLLSYLLASTTTGSATATKNTFSAPAMAAISTNRNRTSSTNATNVLHDRSRHPPTPSIAGVYATVIFKAPKWFHLRYTQMLHNALSNLPDQEGWVVQVFVNEKWVGDNMIEYHPGYERLLLGGSGGSDGDSGTAGRSRVHFIPLPERLTKVKPKYVNVDRWFWESMLADHVVLFSGNGAFCGNHATPPRSGASETVGDGAQQGWHRHIISEIIEERLDFCGVPPPRYQKDRSPTDEDSSTMVIGGDGSSHSYRNRQAMLKVIDYMQQKNLQLDKDSEHGFLVKTMKEMKQEGVGNFRLATLEQTQKFGGVRNLTSTNDGSSLRYLPLVVSGTLPGLSWDDRETVLKHCPEIKMIFPSMHEPACFGAHPDPIKCKASICALQDSRPSSGC